MKLQIQIQKYYPSQCYRIWSIVRLIVLLHGPLRWSLASPPGYQLPQINNQLDKHLLLCCSDSEHKACPDHDD